MTPQEEILDSGRDWKLLHQRQAKETLRSVYQLDGRYIVKKFEVPASITKFRRPWILEDDALRRLNGDGAPRSFGCAEGRENGRRVFWLIKEYLSGTPVDSMRDEDIVACAGLMARIHRHQIITDDANAHNFLLTPDGRMVFLDFGRARFISRPGLRLNLAIGRELAKLRREGFGWNQNHWDIFQRHYFMLLPASRRRRGMMLTGCRAAILCRGLRKAISGKSLKS